MKNSGGPAFPQYYVETGQRGSMETGEMYGEGGITMRDYFAGQALMGLMESMAANTDVSWDDGARACYYAADAMLKVREE